MNCFGLFPGCKVDEVEYSKVGLVFFLHTHQRSSCCPKCARRSKRVHSTYTRLVRDTAMG
ncbi:transposase family protein [Coleofasciculus sp. H7-2]|uniref:transposase family protein n=1 Tax=Coleofasciculus sp. H7-2 TaxID=3351545 RepID=UPI00366C0C22